MGTDLTSMEMQLDCANRKSSELLRRLKKLHQHIEVNGRGWKLVPGWKSTPVLLNSLRDSTGNSVPLFRHLEPIKNLYSETLVLPLIPIAVCRSSNKDKHYFCKTTITISFSQSKNPRNHSYVIKTTKFWF